MCVLLVHLYAERKRQVSLRLRNVSRKINIEIITTYSKILLTMCHCYLGIILHSNFGRVVYGACTKHDLNIRLGLFEWGNSNSSSRFHFHILETCFHFVVLTLFRLLALKKFKRGTIKLLTSILIPDTGSNSLWVAANTQYRRQIYIYILKCYIAFCEPISSFPCSRCIPKSKLLRNIQ